MRAILQIFLKFSIKCNTKVQNKLKQLDPPQFLFNIVESFLIIKLFFVKMNEEKSSFKVKTFASRKFLKAQNLLQFYNLFKQYTSDTPLSSHTNIALFADDTTVYFDYVNPSIHNQKYWDNNYQITHKYLHEKIFLIKFCETKYIFKNYLLILGVIENVGIYAYIYIYEKLILC